MNNPCYACGGNGSRLVRTQESCASCNGLGYVQHWQQPNNPNEQFNQSPGHVQCSNCYGLRFVEKSSYRQCPDCSGSNYVSTNDYIETNYIERSNGNTIINRAPEKSVDRYSGSGCASILLIAGICWAGWWSWGWVSTKIDITGVPFSTLFYGYTAIFWTILCIPLAVAAAVFRLFGGSRFTLVNTIGWATACAVSTFFAVLGCLWMYDDHFGAAITLLATNTAAVAAASVLFPKTSSAALRIWIFGLLTLALLGGLNTFTKPSLVLDCIVVRDVGVWLALKPLTTSSVDIPLSALCAGIQLERNVEKVDRKSSAKNKLLSQEKPTELQTLQQLSNREFAYDRSMAAVISIFLLAVALCASLLAAIVQIAGLSKNHRATNYTGVKVSRDAPRFISWAVLASALSLVGLGAAWTGNRHAPAIALSTSTLRPLLLLSLITPAARVWAEVSPAIGVHSPEKILEKARERLIWQRKQLIEETNR